MRKIMGLSLLFLASLLTAAQDAPRFEVFGGYSYANTSKAFILQRTNLNGWNASVTGNFNRWFGMVGDFGGYYGSPETTVPVVSLPLPPCVFTAPPCPPPVTLVNTNIRVRTHTFLAGHNSPGARTGSHCLPMHYRARRMLALHLMYQ